MINSFKPIQIQSEIIMLHPIRDSDMNRISEIEEDFYMILKEEANTEFIKEKRVNSIDQAKNFVFGIISNYSSNKSYMHLITWKETNNVIGAINLITPGHVKEEYKLEEYNWMIEFFMHKNFWNHGIMTGLVNAVCSHLKSQNVNVIDAVCHVDNIGSHRVLEKNDFNKIQKFDFNKYLYRKSQN